MNFLIFLTHFAEIYGALPRISLAISAPGASSIFDKPLFCQTIPRNCIELLLISTKLRDKVLFTECAIHATGPWTKPQYLELYNIKVRKAVQNADHRISLIIDDIFPLLGWIGKRLKKEGMEGVYTGGDLRSVCFPTYLRYIQKQKINMSFYINMRQY
jgi:hypothetical protein